MSVENINFEMYLTSSYPHLLYSYIIFSICFKRSVCFACFQYEVKSTSSTECCKCFFTLNGFSVYVSASQTAQASPFFYFFIFPERVKCFGLTQILRDTYSWSLQFRTHQFRVLSCLRDLNSCLGTIHVLVPCLLTKPLAVAVQVSLIPCSQSFSQLHAITIHEAREGLSRSQAWELRHNARKHSAISHTLLLWWAGYLLGYLPNAELVQ